MTEKIQQTAQDHGVILPCLKRSTRPTGYNADSPMPGPNDIVGQVALKDLIRSKIDHARAGGLTLPHLLLCGEKECGKMTFATAIAEELGVPISSASGDSFVNPLDLSGMLTNVRPREILAIRDVDAVRPSFVNRLVLAIASSEMQITIGTGSGARLHTMSLPRFTLVGTTSKPWLVDEKLRRWYITCQFASYTPKEAAQIVMRIAWGKGVPLDLDAAADVAIHCRLKPGEVDVFLQRVATHFTFAATDRVDPARLGEIEQYLGAGDLAPSLLSVADQIRSMDGLEFEYWVADLFRRAGFQVEITQASGDHGVDLWAYSGTRMVAVQCKRWDGAIGEPVLRDLYGAMTAAKAQCGCLVTTGSFTAQASQFSRDKPLRLVGFDALMEATKSPDTLLHLLG
jgi:Holliday junction resolvasome RuvABC ATP-dependent DNA helicase subunit